MENNNCTDSFVTEIVLDDGRTFTFESVEDEYDFLIDETFLIVTECDETIAMFNLNNVVSVIFD